MCEFCLKHGEGKKWYLEARNYSEDLLHDLSRMKFIENFFNDTDKTRNQVERFAQIDKAPSIIKKLVRWRIPRKMKKFHFGQVVPIEDMERIFEFVLVV